MAGDPKSKSSSRPAASKQAAVSTRAFPVLVPQDALAGQPDIPLSRPVTTVGSNETARLHLVSRTVSKGHAIFVNSGAGTYVADLASRTGVLVNGKIVKDADLKYGDRVQIGKFVFRYKPVDRSAAAPAPAAPPAAVIVVGWPALPVNTRVVQIGRRETSDIPLTDDAAVSAAHAVIFQMNGKWYIRDVGSRTGTHINGKAIHQERLNFGDRIVIGASTILFQPSASIEEMASEPTVEESVMPFESVLPAALDDDLESESIAPLAIAATVPLALDKGISFEGQPAAEPQGSLGAYAVVESPEVNDTGIASASVEKPFTAISGTEPSGSAAAASIDESASIPLEEFEGDQLEPELSAATADDHGIDDLRANREPSGSAAGAPTDDTPIPLEEFSFVEPLHANESETAEKSFEQPAIEFELELSAATADDHDIDDLLATTEPSGSAAGAPTDDASIPLEEFSTIERLPATESETAEKSFEQPAIEFELELSAATADDHDIDDLRVNREPSGSADGAPTDDTPIPLEEFSFVEPLPANEPEVAETAFEQPAIQFEPELPTATVDDHGIDAPRVNREPSGSAAGTPTDEGLIPLEEFSVVEPLPANDHEVSATIPEQPAIELEPKHSTATVDDHLIDTPRTSTEPSGSAAGAPTDEAPIPFEEFSVLEPLQANEPQVAETSSEQPAIVLEPALPNATVDDHASTEPSFSAAGAPTDEAPSSATEPATASLEDPGTPATDETAREFAPVETPLQAPSVDPPGIVTSQNQHDSVVPTVNSELIAPVADFVFVPVEENAAAASLPEVLFWGDAELDANSESTTASVKATDPTDIAAIEPVVADEPPIPLIAPYLAHEHFAPADPQSLSDEKSLEPSASIALDGPATLEVTAIAPQEPAVESPDVHQTENDHPAINSDATPDVSPQEIEQSTAPANLPDEVATQPADNTQDVVETDILQTPLAVEIDQPIFAEIPAIIPTDFENTDFAAVELPGVDPVNQVQADSDAETAPVQTMTDADVNIAGVAAENPVIISEAIDQKPDFTFVETVAEPATTALDFPMPAEFSATLPVIQDESAVAGQLESEGSHLSVELPAEDVQPVIFESPDPTESESWSLHEADESFAADALTHMFGEEASAPARPSTAASPLPPLPVEPFSLPTEVAGLALASALTVATGTAAAAAAHATEVPAAVTTASAAVSALTGAASHLQNRPQFTPVEPAHFVAPDVSELTTPDLEDPSEWSGISTVGERPSDTAHTFSVPPLDELDFLEPEPDEPAEWDDETTIDELPVESPATLPESEPLELHAAVAPAEAVQVDDLDSVDLDSADSDFIDWDGISTIEELPIDAHTTLSEPPPIEAATLDDLESLEAESVGATDAVDLSEVQNVEQVAAANDARHVESVAVESPVETDVLESFVPARVEPEGEIEWPGPGAVSAIADSAALGALPTSESALSAGLSLIDAIPPVTMAADESIDSIDFEFIEPEGIDAEAVEPQVETAGAIEWAGISTVDELPDSSSVTQTLPAPESETDDLDFLEFTDTGVAASAATDTSAVQFGVKDQKPVEQSSTPTPPPPQPPQPPDALTTQGKPTGPSLFGFEFEGGSFLGGMPLPLNASATGAAKAVAAAAVTTGVLNALAAPITGLGAMASGIAGSGAVSLPPSAPRLNRRRPAKPPTIPPAKTFSKPESLSGLVSEAKVPWAQAPAIPPTARMPDAGPKLARAAQPMSTSFNTPGAVARNAEVFSQMTAPIGVEVFGGRPGNPAQFKVPDFKTNAAVATETGEAAAATAPPVAYQIPRPARKSRLPILIVLLIAAPIVMWQIAYRIVPVSSQVTGSIQFTGIKENTPQATDFVNAQKQRLYSDEVRMSAAEILKSNNKPAGFLDDSDQYLTTVDEKHVSWDRLSSSLQLAYNTSNPKAGKEQIAAVFQALKQKDQDLQDAQQHAQADVDAARSKINSLTDESAKKMEQHEALVTQAQAVDRPSDADLAKDLQDVDALNQKWTDAKAGLNGIQLALQKLQRQDLTKPIDVEADPQVIDLETQLRPLLDEIRSKKNGGGVTLTNGPRRGTDVSVNATTQPTAIDPLVMVLQKRADVLQKKLDDRKSVLLAIQSIDPVERAAMHDRQMKDLTSLVAGMQKTEQDAHAAYDTAVAMEIADKEKSATGRKLDVQKQDLIEEIQRLDTDRKSSNEDLKNKEATLASCIHLNGEPNVSDPSILTDFRPGMFAIGTAITCFLVCMMIAGELRRPKPIGGFEPPAAAPLVTPPARLIPWPQPRDLQGLQQQPKVDAEEMMA